MKIMKFSSKKAKIFFAAFILIFSLTCCHNYYKATKPRAGSISQKASVVDSLYKQGRYFILRSGNQAYYIDDIVLSEDGHTIQCTLDTLPRVHQLYLTKGRRGKMQYKVRAPDDLNVLNEVHFYIAPESNLTAGHYTLQIDQVQKIEIIEKDKTRTTISHVLGGLAIGIGVTAVIGIIAVASYTPPPVPSGSISCSPQVYTVGNNKSELNGTLCSGAIYASLKRTDYLPVNNMKINSGELNLILRGEKNEELMMKDFQLIKVTHNSGQKILVDKNGDALAYEHPVIPEHAFIGAGKDVVNDITAPDEKYYSFTNEAENGSSHVVLDFKKPAGASSGRLIIRGKNSGWAYYVFNEFKKLYGENYHSLIQKKDNENPVKVLQCEIDQSLPLLVSVKDGKDWKLVDYFFTPGNAAARDMIMQLNLDDFKNEDHIQIKLQTVYMFWDVDYVAMDFSNYQAVSVSYIMPSKFYKSGNISQPFKFSKDDTSYMHINGNEQLHLAFNVNDNDRGKESTYFLAGNGYYHDNTVFKEKARLTELRKCSGKGGFDKFSRRKFEEVLAGPIHQQNDSKKDFEILK
jgi:hypothetical protein